MVFLANTLSNLKNVKIVNDDNYTNLIVSNKRYKTIRIPNLIGDILPFHRYNVINYSLSVIPIPKFESTFDFLFKRQKI